MFAVVIPCAKTLALAAVHFDRLGPGALPLVEAIGKFSMADVFLVAVYIVVVKGVGIGYMTIGWGRGSSPAACSSRSGPVGRRGGDLRGLADG